ncbi:MAG: AzlD domain-containing protein [Spirochaetales bacterium]|nr:AzlD domain-containing protein [Spirochaetales bacterium]
MISKLPFILLSALATYIPRAVPFFMSWLSRLPAPIKKFLAVMPVAALGSLLFPSVLLEFSHAPAAGIIGVIAAAVVAWFRGGLILSILASIVVTYFVLMAY